jgi:acetyl-CoA/propionyl-CoA carboxylase biotin carboxyl carrier protein
VGRAVEVVRDGHAVWLVDDGVATRWSPAEEVAAEHSGGGSLEAPMPGVVLDVRTATGATVAQGDVLVVLESMKMELTIAAAVDGVVAEIGVAVGDRVALDQPLARVQAE